MIDKLNNTNTIAESSNTIAESSNTIAESSNTIAESSNTITESLNALERQYKKDNTIIKLSQSWFANGTLRIQQPGIYKLTENIILEPNKNKTCFPLESQKEQYPSSPGPYSLGFFAGITIETDNVILDLNGFTIKQSNRFYLLQRFFSIIELASSPFITGQGPGKFGENVISPKNVVIKNGHLGLSSHHAIHGNGSSNLLIKNITIKDFEVGGISLNGVKNCIVKDVIVKDSLGTNLKVPVNGRFSSAVYLWRMFEKLKDKNLDNYSINFGKNQYSISEAHFNLDKMIREIAHIVESSNLRQPIHYKGILNEEFGNPSGLVDCSAIYGILFNKIGIAVNEFGACDPKCDKSNFSNNISLENVSINNLIVNPVEVVGILNEKKEFLKDFSGSLVMVTQLPWFKNNIDNKYSPKTQFVDKNGNYDMLLLNQVLLYKFFLDTNTKWAKGVAKISDNIVKWVTNTNTTLEHYGPVITARNGDIMGHVMKGSVALRMDFVKNSCVKNVSISNISNVGDLGLSSNELQGYIDGSVDNINKNKNMHNSSHLGHPKSNDNEVGYTGNTSRGVSMVNCDSVVVSNLDVNYITSRTGSSYGVDLLHNNIDTSINKSSIRNIQGTAQYLNVVPLTLQYKLPNWIPKAVGIIIRYLNKNCTSQECDISSISCVSSSCCLLVQSPTDNLTYSVGNQKKYDERDYQISNNSRDIMFDRRAIN